MEVNDDAGVALPVEMESPGTEQIDELNNKQGIC